MNTTPTLLRKLAVILYDSLLLLGVIFVAGLLFQFVTRYELRHSGGARLAFQLYLIAIVAAYFTWFWHRDGQTLAMKAWRVRVRTAAGAPLSAGLALWRFVLACVGWLLLGLTLWWSIFDRDKQFLHDRIAGTRLQQIQ